MNKSTIELPQQDWLVRLRRGEDAAFKQLVEKYQTSVFLCCRSMGLNETESEDVASETFLAVYKGIKSYNGKSSIGTWLWRIAYRQAINYLRQKKRWNEAPDPLEQDQFAADDSLSASQTLDRKALEEAIWEKVNQLPKLWSIAIILFYREEKSITEIAEIMNINDNTIKTYLFRGKKALSTTLERFYEGKQDD